jgi:6-phosphogluconate dehydrogenase (decarboxylating)
MQIGIAGIGRMGGNMVRRLLRGGQFGGHVEKPVTA